MGINDSCMSHEMSCLAMYDPRASFLVVEECDLLSSVRHLEELSCALKEMC